MTIYGPHQPISPTVRNGFYGSLLLRFWQLLAETVGTVRNGSWESLLNSTERFLRFPTVGLLCLLPDSYPSPYLSFQVYLNRSQSQWRSSSMVAKLHNVLCFSIAYSAYSSTYAICGICDLCHQDKSPPKIMCLLTSWFLVEPKHQSDVLPENVQDL